jgi:TM2 domain-containing membrane protein YozV
MKVSTRAALLSGLILPGLGQHYNGQRLKGVSIMAATVLLVGALGWRIFSLLYRALSAPEIMDRLPFSLTPQIIARLHQQAYVQNWWLLLLIAGLWIFSIADAYRGAGKREPRPVGPAT